MPEQVWYEEKGQLTDGYTAKQLEGLFRKHDKPDHSFQPYVRPQTILKPRLIKVGPRVVWQAQPRQADFLMRPEYEKLYGGAAGGGKTDAELIWLELDYECPWYAGLFLRKTYPELEQAIVRSEELFPRIVPGARFNGNKHVWRFPSGARIYMGAMFLSRDKTKYQGRAFDKIAFDELVHFTYDEYTYMFSRNRPSGPGTRVSMGAGSNPGGIGHAWVKARFIDNRLPFQAYSFTMIIDGKEYIRHRVFIPATVYDNKILLQNDPFYIANLGMLPEAERRALFEGDWNTFSGQAFVEWRDFQGGYKTRSWSHVIEWFKVPPNWRIYRAFDFGYSRPFSVHWYAMDNDGRLYTIRELYGCSGVPNTGVKWNPAQIAKEIVRIEKEEFADYGTVRGLADPSIWDASRGESIARMMEREGVVQTPWDSKRIPGKQQIHWRLAFDEAGWPMLYVMKNCPHMIRTIPTLVYDQIDVEDIDTDGEDHAYDDLRGLCMDHPLPPRSHTAPPIQSWDPLNQHEPEAAPMFINF